MPRYFFDFQDDDKLSKDDEGSLIDGQETARSEAIILLSEIVKDTLPDGEHRRFVVIAREEGGQPIYRAALEFHGEWTHQRSPI